MFSMYEAVMKSFSCGSGPAVFLPASLEWMTKAIQLMEKEEGQGGSDVLMQAVDLICSGPKTP